METKKFIIHIHSWVSLITNSSTEIYTTCNTKAVDMVKEIVNKILKAAKSDKTAEDILQIRTWQYDYDYEEDTEIKNYENVDYDHETNPVYLEVILLEENLDISDLFSNIFDSQEFAA